MSKKYRPDQVVVTVGGQRITGFAEGSFVEVVRNEEEWENVPDAYGEDVTRVQSHNKTGEISLTLKQDSPSLAYLVGLNKSGAQVPVSVNDLSPGRPSGRVGRDASVELPDFTRGADHETQEVVLKATKIEPA